MGALGRGIAAIIFVASCRIDFDAVGVDGAASSRIGGTASGVTGTGLVLQNNGSDDLAIAGDGPFTFATALGLGASYAITIRTPPAGQTCLVANATGTITGPDVTSVVVTCFAPGACPTSPISFTTDDTFTLPAGCTAFSVEASGGGGAGGGRNLGSAAAAGGAGGYTVLALAGQTPGTSYVITIGAGGTCESTTMTAGGYLGGRGGVSAGNGTGGDGAGTTSPPGGAGGAGSTGTQPGGGGGNGGYGGGGGGGGGDTIKGNSGGGATTFRAGTIDYVVAGGGGGGGAADQDGDIAGAGGDACNGYAGANGAPAAGGTRSGGGGGGGACYCLGGTCGSTPTSAGGPGGIAAASGACTAAQNGAAGQLIISFQ